jgi:fumarate reductase subunit D
MTHSLAPYSFAGPLATRVILYTVEINSAVKVVSVSTDFLNKLSLLTFSTVSVFGCQLHALHGTLHGTLHMSVQHTVFHDLETSTVTR